MKKQDIDINRGWAWFVLVAVYIGIIIMSTTMFMGGVLYVALLEQYNADKAKTSLVGALNGGLLCLLGPLASLVMTTFSCRICMFVGGLLLTISCLTSAFVGSVDLLILTYGIIGGIGNCLTSFPFVVVLGYYFCKRRNMVIAISQAVIGVGFFIASPLALIILNRFGLQGTFLILGGMNAQLCVIAIICKPSSVEKRLLESKLNSAAKQYKHDTVEAEAKFLDDVEHNAMKHVKENVIKNHKSNENGKSATENVESISGRSFLPETAVNYGNPTTGKEQPKFDDVEYRDLLVSTKFGSIGIDMDAETEPTVVFERHEALDNTYSNGTLNKYRNPNHDDGHVKSIQKGGLFSLHLIKNLRFMMFLCSTMSWNFTLSMCIMHLPNYMTLREASIVEISAIMTCFSASNLAGRFIAAMTVDRGGLDSITLHVGMLGVAGLVTLTFPWYSGAVGDYIFTAAIGLYTGGPNSLMTPITLKMVNIEDLSTAHGLEYFFMGLGYVPGPFIAGLLYSLSGAYEFSFICGGCILLLGCVFAMISTVNPPASVTNTADTVT